MRNPITAAIAAILLTGCVTTYEDRARHQAHQRSDFDIMEEKSQQLSGRVEGVEMQLEDVQRDLRNLRQDMLDSGENTSLATSSRIDALEAKLSAIEANRERDRQEIIDKLTEKITAIMNTRPTATPQPRVARTRPTATSEYGYEHQVQQGETLSQIASAYGVSMQSIIDANGIQNANDLKVGTRLFVPE